MSYCKNSFQIYKYGETALIQRLHVTQMTEEELRAESDARLPSSLAQDIHRGRADVRQILRQMAQLVSKDRHEKLIDEKQKTIAVLACGPEVLVDGARQMCRRSLGGRFEFHSEKFTF